MNKIRLSNDKKILIVSIIYSLVTFLTFFCELGIFIWGIGQFGNVIVPLILLLIFRISHVLSGQVVIKHGLFAASIVLIGGILFSFTLNVLGLSVIIFIIEFGLHSLRETFKPSIINRYWKDVPRAIAFCIAFLFSPVTLLFLSLATFAVITISIIQLGIIPINDNRVEVITDIKKIRTFVPEYAFVLFHHLHFFIYCYFIILYFKIQFNVSNYFLGMFYLIGWVGYFFIYYFPPKSKIHALLGHLLCFVSIIAIPYSTNIILTLFLWFLTGVGGGTIFIRCYFKQKKKFDEITCDIYEGIGQIVGIAISIVLLNYSSSEAVFFIAAMSAAACGISTIFISKVNVTTHSLSSSSSYQ